MNKESIHHIGEQEEYEMAHQSDSRIQGDIYPQELQQKYPHEQYTVVQRRRFNPTTETTSMRKRLMRRIGRTGK